MIALVDESGCTGVKLDSGSSSHFTVVAVLFRCDQVAEECCSRIEELRKEQRVTKEFHFNKCSDENRRMFFESVLPFEFSYCGVVIDKKKFLENSLLIDDRLVESLVVPCFRAIKGLKNATVIFDRTGSSTFRKTLSKNLKHSVNNSAGNTAIRRVKHEDSHRNSLLQLADMTCGAVSRSYSTKRKGADVYREQINSKELFITNFP